MPSNTTCSKSLDRFVYSWSHRVCQRKYSKEWLAAARDQPQDWDKLFAGYQAIVDWPGCSFYAELMGVYPDAKVILTVRDPEKWHESVVNSIYRGLQFNWLARTLFSVVGFLSPSWRTMRNMQKALVWEGTFHGRTSEKAYAIKVFEEYNAEVQRRVPPEKLLTNAMCFYRSRADERRCGLGGQSRLELEEKRGLERTKKDFP